MPKGRQTKALTQEQIALLEEFRKAPHEGAAGGYSVTQLQRAMALPFTAETLKKALQGRPIWDLRHSWLVAWIERYLKAPAPSTENPQDESDAKEAGTTRTVRGSR